MPINKIKSYAKINLSLGVIKKVKKLHRIESLIAFIDLHDSIYIKKINKKSHSVKFYGKFSNRITINNSIFKLIKLLDKRNLLKGKKYSFIVNKKIPQQSGMGGGSMNAATILKYFLRKKILILNKKEIEKISYSIGSDVPLGLDNRNSIVLSNGKIQRVKKRLRLFLLIVKPPMGCSTKIIYRNVRKFSNPKINKNYKFNFNLKNLMKLKNDLEKIAIKKYPTLLNLKKILEKLPRVKFVRMTGSGSAFIAYFVSKKSALIAAKILKSKSNNYWSIISKTI
tara:strand:+ start:145 stop:990 length:846 start_codon:yes stop_codon:yes gene_type:complete